MKKLNLLVGTIGTTAAWYILSNKKLRTELGQAEGPEETIKILKRYIGRDAEKIGKEVYEFFQSEELKEKLDDAKTFAEEKLTDAKTGLSGLLAKGKKWRDDTLKKSKSDAA